MLMKKTSKLNHTHINTFLCSVKNYPRHMHDVFEIVFVLEGSINLKCTAFDYHLTKGDIFIINVKELHSIIETEEQNLLLVFQLDPYPYLEAFPKLDYYYFVCDSYLNKNKNDEKLRILQSSLANILLLIQEEKNNAHASIETFVMELIDLLISDYQSFNLEETGYRNNRIFKNDAVQTSRIFAIQEYIYKNYSQKISVDDLSSSIHLDKYYVSHLFKAATGLNMTDFLCLTRVEYSESLLLSTSMSIDEIAYECGFSAKRYYDKHFMKWFKVRPTEYRKNYLKSIDKTSNKHLFYDLDFYNSVEKLKKFRTIKTQRIGSSSAKSFKIDFSSPCIGFNHSWEKDLYVPDVLNCQINGLQTIISNCQKEIKFTNIKLDNILEIFLEAYSTTPYLNPTFFSFIDFLMASNFNITIMVRWDLENQKKLFVVLEKLLDCCEQKYGTSELKNWSFELYRDDEPAETSTEFTSFKDGFCKITNQYSTDIKIRTKHCLTHNNKRIEDSTYLIPSLIHKALNSKNATSEVFRTLFDISTDSNGSNNLLLECNGLLTITGIKKPIYHAWHMLSMLGNEINMIDNGIISTRRKDDFYVLVYDFKNIDTLDFNMNPYKKDIPKVNFTNIIIEIKNLKHDYTLTKFLLDSKDNPFKQFSSVKLPKSLSEEERSLLNSSLSPKTSFSSVFKKTTNKINIQLAPFSAALLIFKKS